MDAVHAPTARGTWIVGLDGSERANSALSWATINAPKRTKGLELITAWQIPVGGAYPVASPASFPFDDEELVAAAANEIEKLAKHAREESGLPVEVTVVQGGYCSTHQHEGHC